MMALTVEKETKRNHLRNLPRKKNQRTTHPMMAQEYRLAMDSVSVFPKVPSN